MGPCLLLLSSSIKRELHLKNAGFLGTVWFYDDEKWHGRMVVIPPIFACDGN